MKEKNIHNKWRTEIQLIENQKNKTFYMAGSQNYSKIELKKISNLKKNV